MKVAFIFQYFFHLFMKKMFVIALFLIFAACAFNDCFECNGIKYYINII